MFKIDLHSHTRYSDGTGTPAQIAAAAKAAGLHGLALTDHNSNDGPAAYPGAVQPDPRELHAVAGALRDVGVVPFIGCEYSTAQGHLLIYGVVVPRMTWGMYPEMQDVIDEVNARGGACIVPHAFHGYQRAIKSGLTKITGLAAVEGWNGRVEAHNPGTNKLARVAAEAIKAPLTASTDAHSPRELGRCYTAFPSTIASEKDLVAALHAGQFKAHCDEAAYAADREVSIASRPLLLLPSTTSSKPVRKAPARTKRARPESALDLSGNDGDEWIPDSWRMK